MSTLPRYAPTSPGYYSFKVDAGQNWPDWDSSLYVEFYDLLGTLRLTITTDDMARDTDAHGHKYVYASGLDLNSFAPGVCTAFIYAEVGGVQISPYPSELPAFEVIDTTIPEEEESLVIGTDNWIRCLLYNSAGNPVIGLDYDDMICKYWSRVYEEFQTKSLDSDLFVEVGAGEYRILYSRQEVCVTGPFITQLYPTYDNPNVFVTNTVVSTATSTVSGTCCVTGRFLDLDGQPLDSPVEIVVDNLYNPINYNIGSVILPSKRYFSDVEGYFEIQLLQSARVRVSIGGGSGIVGTITIPTTNSANLMVLLDSAEDEYEPV